QPEAGPLGVNLGIGAEREEAPAQFGDQPHDVGRALAHLSKKLNRPSSAGVRADDLHPRPVRGGALALPARTPQDVRAERCGVLRGRLGERRLTDARLAGDQDEPSAAFARPAGGLAKDGDLAVPTDEPGGAGTGLRAPTSSRVTSWP